MHFVDLYPTKGTFPPSSTVRIVAEAEAESSDTAVIHLSILHLARTIDTLSHSISLRGGKECFMLDWRAPFAAPRGYGVTAELRDLSGTVIDTISTAFDTLPDWTAFPRYGFLTDFTPARSDITDTLDVLAQFHINGLQFYDWQYRHDTLLPPESDYIDPLGRALSLTTVREFIEAAHIRGMATMPYVAVYAASVEFWQAHPEWALYDVNDQPITFEDFLGLMDPTPGSPWIEHLRGECSKVLANLPFDGLHVDQYGDPKDGFNADGSPVDIPAAFTMFIRTLKKTHPRAAVVFNAVGNWPIEALATAPQDFVYVEIWPPDVFYRDVRRIVANARAISGDKPVVIALYLPASRPENVRLADALIFSLGGSRIELGEKAQLLADPYFPKHQPLSPDLKRTLRRYYDFVVRYGDLLGPAATASEKYEVSSPPDVWTIVRSSPGWVVLSLINMSGLGDPRWDKLQSAPSVLEAVCIKISFGKTIHQAWWASPDLDDLSLAPLPWTVINKKVSICLRRLDYWAIIALELETME
jgi:dextranase